MNCFESIEPIENCNSSATYSSEPKTNTLSKSRSRVDDEICSQSDVALLSRAHIFTYEDHIQNKTFVTSFALRELHKV
jgi:hypothetical protein